MTTPTQMPESLKVPTLPWLLVRDDGDIWNFGRTSACPEVFPSIVPTHWMPLPDAPNAAASIGSGKESAS